jgi:hypothetical protein
MRINFEHYYKPSDAEFQRFWTEAWFVFDTSALLGFYRNSASFIDEALEIIGVIHRRLWLPHQVAQEYHDSLPGVEAALFSAAQQTQKAVTDLVTKLQKEVYGSRHPYLRDEMLKAIEKFKKNAEKLIREKELNDSEILRSRIDLVKDLLDHQFRNVGQAYDESRLKEIYADGKVRYESRIPPGFEDADKRSSPEAKYGDLIIWEQMIDHAKATGKPLILITDDRKEDWWLIRSGQALGPHPLLRGEMKRESGQDFYAYNIEQFVEHGVPKFLQREPEPAAAADAEVSERAEVAFRRGSDFQKWKVSNIERVANEDLYQNLLRLVRNPESRVPLDLKSIDEWLRAELRAKEDESGG